MSDHDHDHKHVDDGHSPRKRRRLGSVSHTTHNARDHKEQRLRHETNYRDEYRELFNDHVTQTVAQTQPSTSDEAMVHSRRQLGASLWSHTEKAALFTALDRVGRHDLPGIAAAVATKTQPEVRAFLTLLRDPRHVKLTLRHVPAAADIDGVCAATLEDAADALAWYQETLEAAQEQKRHGEYWLITPEAAAKIEGAVRAQDDVPTAQDAGRPGPQAPSPDPPPNTRGRGAAGACVFCKARKKKCDRQSPCAYCVRFDVQCVYPHHAPAPAPARHDDADHKKMPLAVPEAALLRPETMLQLSRDIFMNRSPDFPSPWLHWSQYTSELASAPSMYRTAFTDFHTLAVSITRRLVQTTVAQASSRLRAQRHRNTKRAKPMITLRDAYSAIDVLGLERNGHERWRGAPRRCGLQVFTHRYTPKKGKLKHNLSWINVEQALSSTHASDEAQANQSDASIEPDNYKLRMARSGTPLPMHRLTLSDHENDAEHTDMSEDDDSETSDQSEESDLYNLAHRAPQAHKRSPSVASHPATHEQKSHSDTIENFDHAASKEEEDTLCRLLGIQTPVEGTPPDAEDQEHLDVDLDEKITAAPENWERYFDFQMPWERYTTPVPEAQLLANQKAASPMPKLPDTATHSPESDYDNASRMESTERLASRRHESTTETELQARGTNAYAAWRREDFGESDEEVQSTSSESEIEPTEHLVAQSIESGNASVN